MPISMPRSEDVEEPRRAHSSSVLFVSFFASPKHIFLYFYFDLVIPRQLVIIQFASVITEHKTVLPKNDGSQAADFDF